MLELQKKNLATELSENQKASNGFVTTPFTAGQLEEIIAQDGAFVTEINEKVVAYLYGGSWSYYDQWPIFPYMTSRFPGWKTQHPITTANSFQYGPVCIDSAHRGKKIINRLFETLRLEFADKYPLAGTFINQANSISTRAHLKIGWEIADEFEYNDNRYFGLVYNMNNEVII